VQSDGPQVPGVPLLRLNHHFPPPEGNLSMEFMQSDEI
jgi:hypothetical protein